MARARQRHPRRADRPGHRRPRDPRGRRRGVPRGPGPARLTRRLVSVRGPGGAAPPGPRSPGPDRARRPAPIRRSAVTRGSGPPRLARVGADQRRVLATVLLDQPAGQPLRGRQRAAASASCVGPTAPARPTTSSAHHSSEQPGMCRKYRRMSPGSTRSRNDVGDPARRRTPRRRRAPSAWSSSRSVRSATVPRCWVIERAVVAHPPVVDDRRAVTPIRPARR